jgi:DNA-binding XRE family transcriptional regulator
MAAIFVATNFNNFQNLEIFYIIPPPQLTYKVSKTHFIFYRHLSNGGRRIKMTRQETIEKLIEYQQSHGMTQGELAEELGVPIGTVQNWCTGRRMPNYDNMEKIKQFLELR